jgi:hypothetical protein
LFQASGIFTFLGECSLFIQQFSCLKIHQMKKAFFSLHSVLAQTLCLYHELKRMYMKTLDIEQLSMVAGAEPRGLIEGRGRQLDGTDITSSNTKQGANSGDVIVGYRDGSVEVYFAEGGKSKKLW